MHALPCQRYRWTVMPYHLLLLLLGLSGELPVLLAVEAAAGRRRTVLAEAAVLHTLQEHRLAELKSTGEDSAQHSTAQHAPIAPRQAGQTCRVGQPQAGMVCCQYQLGSDEFCRITRLDTRIGVARGSGGTSRNALLYVCQTQLGARGSLQAAQTTALS